MELVAVGSLSLSTPSEQSISASQNLTSRKILEVIELEKEQSVLPKLHKKNYLDKTVSFIASIAFLSLFSIGLYLFLSKQTFNSALSTNAVASPTPAFQSNIIALADVTQVPSGTFSYGGSLSFAPLRSQIVANAIAQAHPQFKLEYKEPLLVAPGDHQGVKMLLENQLNFSQNSMSLSDDEYKRARDRGFKLLEVAIGIDAVVFFTHSGVDIAGLSVEQLQAIYLGKITNWNQVGGPNLTIKPIANDPKDSNALQILMENVPGGVNSVKGVKVVRDFTTAIKETSATPGAIGYGSVSTVVGQKTVRPVAIAKRHSTEYISPYTAPGQINKLAIQSGDYCLTRNLFVDIRLDNTFNQQAGLAYTQLLLSWEGQKLIEQSGFIPLR